MASFQRGRDTIAAKPGAGLFPRPAQRGEGGPHRAQQEAGGGGALRHGSTAPPPPRLRGSLGTLSPLREAREKRPICRIRNEVGVPALSAKMPERLSARCCVVGGGP